MGKLENKVALIAGGNGGIGLATAQEFIGEGASVFITARPQKALDDAVAKIGRKISPRPLYSWPRRTADIFVALSCSSTAGLLRFDRLKA